MALVPGAWLRPWWWERQADPSCDDFVPGSAWGGSAPVNVTRRSWFLLGSLAVPDRAAVDGRGLVALGGWSLDWWVGAGDRWYLPSRETAVRQRLVESAPVVETAMRIPGGDALHRAFVARAAGDSGDHVVVEVRNDSSVAVALALSVRPTGLFGPGTVREVDLSDRTVFVDGLPALYLPRAPGAAAGCTGGDGDVVHRVLGGLTDAWAGAVRCPDGMASASFVTPVAHGATVRVLVPLRVASGGGPGGGAARIRGRRPREKAAQVGSATSVVPAVPASAQVAAGWHVQTRRGARFELPDERLAASFEAARRSLLLFHGGEEVVTWPPRVVGWSDAAVVLAALDRCGLHSEVEEVLAALPDRQLMDGYVTGEDGRRDAPGAALWVLGVHWALTGDVGLVEDLVGPVAKAAHWIDKRRLSRRHRRDPSTVGLPPDGVQPPWIGGTGASYLDSWWSLAGLVAAAPMVLAAGQPELAGDLRRFADGLDGAVQAAVARDAQRLGCAAVPSRPGGVLDATVAANLAAVGLGVRSVTDPSMVATAEAVLERASCGCAVVRGADCTGLSPRLTLDLATVELRAGEVASAAERLRWVVEVGGATAAWPEVVHPVTGGGSAGDGHDGPTTAEFVSFVRRLLVDERPGGLALASGVVPGWFGQGWEVHDAPTPHGSLSYAVRWHGERPALLWELDVRGDGPVVLSAPGLDPSWSSQEPKGEVLLAPVPDPASDRLTASGGAGFS